MEDVVMKRFFQKLEAYFAAAGMAESGLWDEALRIVNEENTPQVVQQRPADTRPRMRV